jgi:hypothetical protein
MRGGTKGSVALGLLGILAFGVPVRPVRAAEPAAHDAAAIRFFESEVRPILVGRCQECHGPRKSKGDLRLDSRAALLAGGQSGPAIVPGAPAESLLIDAINYGEPPQMPPKSKLPPREIATLTRWVEMGAPWPASTSAAANADAVNGDFDLQRRARHWSFQPLQGAKTPDVQAVAWPRTSIDAFLLAGLEARGLAPGGEADRRTWLRRVTFDLTGLPPTPLQIAAFLADTTPAAFERVVDRLLASPHYGERWARHWLDLVGFAETSGHEFDYEIPDAYRYRDYVVRAFNADLPYDQFVIEQMAGDLMGAPRRHPTDGSNESILGTGIYFLGEGTHSPVDLPEDEAIRIDHQIDVLSKTFLGLTVACARCHDHKFDPITTRDYYALSGYLKSSRHDHAFIDPPTRIAASVSELEAIKGTLGDQIAAVGRGWETDPEAKGPATASASPPPSPKANTIVFEDFKGPAFDGWAVTGDAFGTRPTRSGDWLIRIDGTTTRAALVSPGVAHSGLLADRLQGVLRSPSFVIERRYLHILAAGREGRINLVIDGFEKIRSPIYGDLTIAVNSDRAVWHTQNVGMWLGHRAYVEIADGATVNYTNYVAQGPSPYYSGEGYIAVDEIRFSDEPPAQDEKRSIVRDVADLGGCNHPCSGHPWDDNLIRFKSLAAEIPAPRLALAIVDGTGEDARVHVRGSTRNLGPVVPRRFLEVVAGSDQSAPERGSGRLELARRIVNQAQPMLARVLVNRVWKHHFGEGIVRTPDDFGVMGRPPSHPELLDDLAARFLSSGWSIKGLHRLIVLSSAYRMRSEPDSGDAAERLDPSNEALHRMNLRRLEAEAIRDALLTVSGRLDRTMFGPSVAPHLTRFLDGRGRPPASGPLDGNGRRSLYLNVRRNFLNPMFLAFDFPAPSSPMGRRNISNVPAQALTLLNDPFVQAQAALWAEDDTLAGSDRMTCLYETALGRPPDAGEIAAGLAFVAEQARAYGQGGERRAWADMCHVLFNTKEFIYVK